MNIIDSTRKGIVLLILVAVAMFVSSVVIPKYLFVGKVSYFSKKAMGNMSICCINDTYTCDVIVKYVNESIQKLGDFDEINIVIFSSFDDYMRSSVQCNIVVGLNEFEYIIAKDKNKIRHVDYFTTYSLLSKVPHNDLLFKSFIVAIPYCYEIELLDKIRCSEIIKEVLVNRNISSSQWIKIYRLIVVESNNDLLENISLYIIENNLKIYNKNLSCRSIYDNANITTINNLLSYYDIQKILYMIRDRK